MVRERIKQCCDSFELGARVERLNIIGISISFVLEFEWGKNC